MKNNGGCIADCSFGKLLGPVFLPFSLSSRIKRAEKQVIIINDCYLVKAIKCSNFMLLLYSHFLWKRRNKDLSPTILLFRDVLNLYLEVFWNFWKNMVNVIAYYLSLVGCLTWSWKNVSDDLTSACAHTPMETYM